MKKTSEPKLVRLRDLDLEDTRFRISMSSDLEPLILSIRKIGLLHCPVVVAREGRLVLVCGWKRVAACLKLRISRLRVLVLDEADDLEVFLFALYENIAGRELSVLEKAEALLKALAFGLAEARLWREVMPLLKVPPTAAFRDAYLAISKLDPATKKMVAEKGLPFSLARMLAELSADSLGEILPVLCPLGQNKQKEIVESLLEISKRRSLSPQKVLRFPEIQAVLRSKTWTPLEKADRFRLALRRRRFPNLTSWEERFRTAQREVRWPREISLEPAPYFETDDIEASFRFKDEREFKARLGELLEVTSQKGFPKLFRRGRPSSTNRLKRS